MMLDLHVFDTELFTGTMGPNNNEFFYPNEIQKTWAGLKQTEYLALPLWIEPDYNACESGTFEYDCSMPNTLLELAEARISVQRFYF